MRYLIKETRQVNRGTPLIALYHNLLDVSDRLMLAVALTKSIVGFRKHRIEYLSKYCVYTLADH